MGVCYRMVNCPLCGKSDYVVVDYLGLRTYFCTKCQEGFDVDGIQEEF